jgi:omega-amidase
MQDLKITVIQSDLHWEDIGANLAMFEEKIWQIGESTDVIVLPEMFTTGFTMKAPKLAEHMNMRTTKWMRQMADQTGALILGSFIANVHDRFYNQAVVDGARRTFLKPTTSAIFFVWLKKIRYLPKAKVY